MSVVATSHIELDEAGVAWIIGANTKVVEAVIDKLAHGSSPEEMHFQYPHLSVAQIYSALAYYYDHQEELDAEIERQLREVGELRKQSGDSPLLRRLRVQGLIR